MPLMLERLRQPEDAVACTADGGRLADLAHEHGLSVNRLGLLAAGLGPQAGEDGELGAAGRHLHEAVLVEMAARGLRDLYNIRLGRTEFNDSKFGRRVSADQPARCRSAHAHVESKAVVCAAALAAAGRSGVRWGDGGGMGPARRTQIQLPTPTHRFVHRCVSL